MEIIGKSKEGFLIAASEDDIAHILGEYSAYRLREKKIEIKIGMVINVSPAYERLYWLENRNRDFDQLCRSLRYAADLIDDKRPLFDSISGD